MLKTYIPSLNIYQAPNGTVNWDIEKDKGVYFTFDPLIASVTKYMSPDGSDASLVVWFTTLYELLIFDSLAPFHPTAKGFIAEVPKRPEAEAKTERGKNVVILHSVYHFCLGFFPECQLFANKMMTSALGPAGLENVNSTNTDTWAGLGNHIGQTIVRDTQMNAMNVKGDFGGKRYNLKPFSDYTGYTPINSANEIVDRARWQPSLSFDKNRFILSSQEFVTPQLALHKPISLDSVGNFTVKPHGRLNSSIEGIHLQFDSFEANENGVPLLCRLLFLVHR